MLNDIENRLLACELENARLQKRISRQNAFWLSTMLLVAGGGAVAGSQLKDAIFDNIKAKEIAVVDANGIVRARLGGDLPDAVMAGGRVSKRGSKAGGLMIYDEEGIERGGYVTMDTGSNALLTLDSKHRQLAYFIAGPSEDQTGALRMWTPASAIELRTDLNGARVTVTDKSGVTYQQPAIVKLLPETCANYKDLKLKYPTERICQTRYTDAACNACLQSE